MLRKSRAKYQPICYNVKMRRLEENRFFPIIAWSVVIGLALFTYALVATLNNVTSTYTENDIYLE